MLIEPPEEPGNALGLKSLSLTLADPSPHYDLEIYTLDRGQPPIKLSSPIGLDGLYRKSEPTGYSNSGKEWLNSAGLLARMNFALQLADNKVPGVKVETAEGIPLGSPDFQRH